MRTTQDFELRCLDGVGVFFCHFVTFPSQPELWEIHQRCRLGPGQSRRVVSVTDGPKSGEPREERVTDVMTLLVSFSLPLNCAACQSGHRRLGRARIRPGAPWKRRLLRFLPAAAAEPSISAPSPIPESLLIDASEETDAT